MVSRATSGRRRKVWCKFALSLLATLAVSALLQRAVSPVGDSVAAIVNERELRVTGRLVEAGSAYTISDGRSNYRLKGSDPTLHGLAGRTVTVAGTLDPRTGSIEIAWIRRPE